MITGVGRLLPMILTRCQAGDADCALLKVERWKDVLLHFFSENFARVSHRQQVMANTAWPTKDVEKL